MIRQIKFKQWSEQLQEWIYISVPENARQYTGLKDKNGVEIFEADILKMENEFGKKIFPVEYKQHEGFCQCGKNHFVGFSLHNFDLKNIEILGNIYQHPELLEKNNG